MTSIDLARKVDGLSDLELALLLSFVANEHCLIETEEEALKSLGQEVLAVCLNIRSYPAPAELSGRLHQIPSAGLMLSLTAARIRP